MKAQILKLGGVTTEAEFYKKYPTEKAFMAKHGKKLEKLKKAAGGGFVPSDIPADAFNPQIPLDTSASPGTKGAFGGIDKFINSDIGGTVSSSSSSSSNKKGFDYGQFAGTVLEAYQDGQASSTYNKKLDQYLDLSKLIGEIKPTKEPKPDYIRPQLVTGATPKGIPAKNGAMIGGNPTEIQNMYTSGDIYTDLGNTNPKQYGWGGELANVNAGWNNNGVTGNMSPGWKAASTAASFIPLVGDVVEFMGQTEANEQAGIRANKQTGFYNNLAASALQNVNAGQFSANLKYGGSIDSMEEGGWVSNDWMPQVIATFGEHKLKDLLKPPHDADMLRAGGHLKQYTPPSAEAMNTGRAEFGAEIQTLWGGDIKQVGVNPILGPLGMLSGAQHSERAPDALAKNGIGIKFGNNVIEAENREGIVMLANGGEIDAGTGKPSKNAYIFGAEPIQEWAKKAIEDNDIKVGTTFKHYYDIKSKQQKKLNKQELDVTEELANFNVDDSYDQLKMNGLMATKKGIDMQNLDLAKYIANAAAVQTAINETDEEMGTAKYGKKLKKAAFGAKMTTAALGTDLPGVHPTVSGLVDLLKKKGYDLKISSGNRPGAKTSLGKPSRHAVGEAVDVQFPKLGSQAYASLTKDADIVKYMMDNGLTALDEYDPKVAKQTGATGAHIHFGFDKGTALSNKFRDTVSSNQLPSPTDEQDNYYMPNSDYALIEQPINQMPAMPQQTQALLQQDQEEYFPIQQPSSQSVKPASKWSKGLETFGNNLLTGLESALPYLRPSNQRPMDPEAFTSEMFTLATNQLEPVQAQKFVPYLTQGIQVSLQDQINEVTAQTRAAERLARGNPEALAMIASQAYDAKNKIKGEEFRLNQGEKQRVAETNRQVLNEANKMNLGIMDEQYVRQQTAKSKTKEQARVALSSISDKILKNKFENKELGIYENLYGFRFGPNGQAYNTNITTFNTPTVGDNARPLNDLTQLEIKKVLDDARKAKSKNIETKGQGGIVKSMHEL